MVLFYIIGIIIYGMGIFLYIDSKTIGSELTPKEARMSLLWPIWFIIWLFKLCILSLNKLLSFILLLFNYDYEKTKLFKFIDKIEYDSFIF